jgi:hypothetical protein
MVDKKTRKKAFKQLEGWFKRNATLDYATPENSTKTFDSYYHLKLQHLDTHGHYALYKSIDLHSQAVTNELVSAGSTMRPTKLKGVVATFDDDGKMKMEFVAYDDKVMINVKGNGKYFYGSLKEFSVNTNLKNDSAFFGGFVGYATFKKLKRAPKIYSSLDFKTTYDGNYFDHYPEGDK